MNESAALQMCAECFSRNVDEKIASMKGRGHLRPAGTRAAFEEMNSGKWMEGKETLKGMEGRSKLLLLATIDKVVEEGKMKIDGIHVMKNGHHSE